LRLIQGFELNVSSAAPGDIL